MVSWQGWNPIVVVGGATLGLVLLGCGGIPPARSSSRPDDAGLEILNPDRPRALRCNPEIRLDRKVPAAVLESMTRRLLQTEARDCSFGFAAFYLPAMQPGSGAWAIAELGPGISVSILGLSGDDEAALLRRAEGQGESFGVWVDDTSYASVVVLQRDGGGLKLSRFFLDGGTNTDPIRIASADHGIELRPAGAAAGGRHYRLGDEGELETWDRIGFLSAARKVRLDVDLPALQREDEAQRARRASAASAGRSQRRAAAQEERWRKLNEWLAVYETALGPARHPVLALGAAKDAGDRAAACTELVQLVDSIPRELDSSPSPSIDTTPLLSSLSSLREACAENREIKVLLDAATATTAWRTLDRNVEQVVSELRPVEE